MKYENKLNLTFPVALIFGLFIGSVVVANVTGSKIIMMLGFPLSVGALAYPITFLCTDILSDVYGKKTATQAVWAGFIANLIVALFIVIAIRIPPAEIWEGQQKYAAVLGSSIRIVIASMIAFLISQLNDVYLFHRIKKRLPSFKLLWLRNNVSTLISQFMDTCIFVLIAFGGVVPGEVLGKMIIGQYLVKIIIAIMDTPFCYVGVWLLSRKNR